MATAEYMNLKLTAELTMSIQFASFVPLLQGRGAVWCPDCWPIKNCSSNTEHIRTLAVTPVPSDRLPCYYHTGFSQLTLSYTHDV